MAELSRRSFVVLGASALGGLAGRRLVGADRAALSAELAHPPKLVWTDVADWPIEGRAFSDRAATYDRLPRRAQGVVRDRVWELSRHTAGMLVRFETDSPELHVRYRLTSASLGMVHMPPTGVSGADLYGLDGDTWRWIGVTMPSKQDVSRRLFADRPKQGTARFQLYLPLYNGVEKLELGTAEGAKISALPARGTQRKPIVCYGTSILQGACASRPGMAWTSIMGRMLDREVSNFGFSGNGRMELEVGRFLAELPAAAFVVDCLPNMTPKQVAERTQPLVHQLRKAQPDVPILLVEDRSFTNAWFDATRQRGHEQRRKALRDAFDALRKDGVKGLHYLAGGDLLGRDDEGATDGSHPNDLGMMRQAKVVAQALRPLLR